MADASQGTLAELVDGRGVLYRLSNDRLDFHSTLAAAEAIIMHGCLLLLSVFFLE